MKEITIPFSLEEYLRERDRYTIKTLDSNEEVKIVYTKRKIGFPIIALVGELEEIVAYSSYDIRLVLVEQVYEEGDVLAICGGKYKGTSRLAGIFARQCLGEDEYLFRFIMDLESKTIRFLDNIDGDLIHVDLKNCKPVSDEDSRLVLSTYRRMIE